MRCSCLSLWAGKPRCVVVPAQDDRPVRAAAIRSNAHSIIMFNLTDFPPAALAPSDIEAEQPDDFLFESGSHAPAAQTRGRYCR